MAEEHADRQIQQTADSLSKRRKLARQGKFSLFGHSDMFLAKQQNEHQNLMDNRKLSYQKLTVNSDTAKKGYTLFPSFAIMKTLDVADTNSVSSVIRQAEYAFAHNQEDTE